VLRPPPPPYSLAPTDFRFPALAALGGRLSLGAGREAVVAVLLAARLAAGAVPATPLSRELRAARAAAAVQWLGATCPDARVRSACVAVADASAADAPLAIASALAKVIEVTSTHLDPAARAELTTLARIFDG
jgi:hypothetical protein